MGIAIREKLLRKNIFFNILLPNDKAKNRDIDRGNNIKLFYNIHISQCILRTLLSKSAFKEKQNWMNGKESVKKYSPFLTRILKYYIELETIFITLWKIH